MTMVDPALAAFILEVHAAYDEIFEKRFRHIEAHAPIGLEISTAEGVAARFYEEGIEFYPEAGKK